MSPASASAQVTSACRLTAALAVSIALPLLGLRQWLSALGVMVGAGVMVGVVVLTSWRVRALLASSQGSSVLVSLAQGAKLLVILGLLWGMVRVLQVPPWSLAMGITAGVVGLVIAFLLAAARRGRQSGKEGPEGVDGAQ